MAILPNKHRFPDFLVIGAHKCGTTALYRALREHPEIHMSRVKEPRYFALEGNPPSYQPPRDGYGIADLTEYLALFDHAHPEQVAGEASPIYTSWHSPERTAQNILRRIPNVKLIVILRQPAIRAWSEYNYMRQQGAEPIRTFAEALAAEDRPERADWFPDMFYFRTGLYATILSHYFHIFSREQLHVILYDDYERDAAATLKAVFEFLGVSEDFSPDTTIRHNKTWHVRSDRLERLTKRLEKPTGKVLYLPDFQRRWTLRQLKRFNRSPPPALSEAMYRELTERYREDILQLQDLIHRDLTLWLS